MSSINDKLTQTKSGGSPIVTTVSSARSIGGTSLSGVAFTNWASDTVHFITYKKKADGSMDKSTQTSWKAILSGTTLGTLTRTGGAADAGNDVGDFIEAAPTSGYAQDLYDGLTQTLNVDGTLKSSIVTTAKINDSAVTTAKINDGAVTSSKIDFTTFSSDTDFDSGDVAPTFASGFGNSTFADVKFRKIGGRVHMKGAVQKASGNLANGDLFFTLPVGYRPALTGTNEADYLCASSGANIVKVKLLADGSVLCNVTSASVTYVFLNNIIFDT